MGGFAVPGMGGGGGSAPSGEMSLKVHGDFDVDFSLGKGMLDAITGTLTTDTNAAGMMSIKTVSKLELRRKG